MATPEDTARFQPGAPGAGERRLMFSQESQTYLESVLNVLKERPGDLIWPKGPWKASWRREHVNQDWRLRKHEQGRGKGRAAQAMPGLLRGEEVFPRRQGPDVQKIWLSQRDTGKPLKGPSQGDILNRSGL